MLKNDWSDYVKEGKLVPDINEEQRQKIIQRLQRRKKMGAHKNWYLNLLEQKSFQIEKNIGRIEREYIEECKRMVGILIARKMIKHRKSKLQEKEASVKSASSDSEVEFQGFSVPKQKTKFEKLQEDIDHKKRVA